MYWKITLCMIAFQIVAHIMRVCMEGKFVLSIGAGNEQLFAIKSAKELGLVVVAVDNNPDSVAFEYADISVNIDIKDRDGVLDIAKKFGIKAVIPAPIGRYISTVGYVNEHLKLIGPYEFATSVTSDKMMFNSVLLKSSLPTAKQFALENILDIGNLQLQYPLIVKPRFGSGSKFVKVIYSEKELKEHLELYMKFNSPLGELLVEELIYGVEFGCDIMVIKGEIKLLNIRSKKSTPPVSPRIALYISSTIIFIAEIKNFELDKQINHIAKN